MNNRWAPLLGAGLGVVFLIFAVKHFGTRSSPDAEAPERIAAPPPAVSGSTGYGWNAREDSATAPDAVGSIPRRPAAPGRARGGTPTVAARPEQEASTARDIPRSGTTGERGNTGAQGGGAIPAGSAAPADAALPFPAVKSMGGIAPQAGKQAGPQPAGDAALLAQPSEPEAAPFVEPGVAYNSGNDERFSTDTQFQIPDGDKIVGQTGSFAAVLQPGWDKGNQDDASLFQIGDNGPHLFKNVNFLRFEFLDDNGKEIGTGTNIGEWKPDEPHALIATWGNGRLSLYVDGQLAGQQTYAGGLNFKDGAPALVGSNFPEGRPVAPGVLSNVQLYTFPLGPGDAVSVATRLNPTAH